LKVTSPSWPTWFCTVATLMVAASCSSEPGEPAADRPNILLVSFDTTRADVLDCYGAEHGASPVIDQLAAEGVLFEHAFSSVPLTLPAHTTMLTGLDPPSHQVRDNSIYNVPEEAEALAEILRQVGYRTFAEVSSIVLLPRYGLDQGFDHYGTGSLGLTPPHTTTRDAEDITAASLELLRGSEPFFGFVHYYDPHHPLNPPSPFAERYAKDPYLGEVARTDHSLGELLQALREQGREDRTLIVFTSDHGEGRGDHGQVSHGILLHDATQKVPLILRHPALTAGRVRGHVAALCDLFPTVLDFLGLDARQDLDGRSLLPLTRGESSIAGAAYMETLAPQLGYDWAALYGLRTLEWKLVEGGQARLFHIAEDPGELRDVAANHPDVLADLSLRLSAQREKASLLARETRVVTGEELRLLGGLGYAALGTEIVEDDRKRPDPYDHIGKLEEIMKGKLYLEDPKTVPQALEIFQRLSTEIPGTFEVWQSLGTALGKLQRDAEALQAFLQASRIHPEVVGIHVDVGLAAMRSGKLGLCRKHLHTALEMEQCPPRAFFMLWQTYKDTGNLAKAGSILTQLLERSDLSDQERREAQRLLKATASQARPGGE
jgi:arylsulfatase A-like enzyme